MGDELNALLGLGDGNRDADPQGAPAGSRRSGEIQPGTEAGVLTMVSVLAIEPNEFQPRQRFVDAELDALAESIATVGLLQPLLLRRKVSEVGSSDAAGGGLGVHVSERPNERYELIAGERRWRAAQRAGLATVPAIVRDVDDRASLEQAVVENLHRADLNPLEEAAAYRQLIDEFSLTQEEVAERVGKSRSAVANLLRLFQLPPAVQRLIASEQLGAGHARALLAFPDAELQETLAGRTVREGLTVRAVEELVRSASQRGGAASPRKARSGGDKPAGVLEIEQSLAEHLATRVDVSLSRDRGRLVVEFADLDDLDRIFRLLS